MGIWCLNTNNTKRLLPKMRVNLTKKKRKKWPKNLEKKPKIETKKKKVFAKARPEIFSNLFTFNKNTPLQKNCTVFFLATGIMILKHKNIYTTMLAFLVSI